MATLLALLEAVLVACFWREDLDRLPFVDVCADSGFWMISEGADEGISERLGLCMTSEADDEGASEWPVSTYVSRRDLPAGVYVLSGRVCKVTTEAVSSTLGANEVLARVRRPADCIARWMCR